MYDIRMHDKNVCEKTLKHLDNPKMCKDNKFEIESLAHAHS